MNVGIQETEHFEGVYPVIRLFDTGDNRLFLFVNRAVHLRLLDLLGADANRFEWIIQEKGESTARFCLRIGRLVRRQKIGLLYLNTISRHHIFYAGMLATLGNTISVLTVHDVNCLFQEKFSLEPRKLVRWLGKKWLVKLVAAFNTVAETVKPVLAAKAGPSRKVFTVPGAVFESTARYVPVENSLQIVIPGSLDKKRRNYEQVFLLHELTRGLPVFLTLLGGGNDAYAKEIKLRCEQSGSERLRWFNNNIVEQEVFDEELNQAHFIWIPSVVETRICGDIPEVYGLTKSSGNIFDIIKHAKPFIYPESLRVPAVLKTAGISYHSVQEIAEAMKLFIENPQHYRKWATEAEKASQQFTVEKVRIQQYPLFEGRIDNEVPSSR